MKKASSLLVLTLITLSAFSQKPRKSENPSLGFPTAKISQNIGALPSGELRNDTLFTKVSLDQYEFIKNQFDQKNVAFYFYSGCCHFGEMGGKVPKRVEVYLASDNGVEYKLITGNKPGSL